MKTTGLLTFLLAGSMSLSAYTPLVEEGKQWSVMNQNANHPDYVKYTTKLQKIEGEEVVNDVTYNKLLCTTNEATDNWNVEALLREEDRKVYALVNDKEYLMFDYNVEQGSKIELFPSIGYIQINDDPIELDVKNIEPTLNKQVQN